MIRRLPTTAVSDLSRYAPGPGTASYFNALKQFD